MPLCKGRGARDRHGHAFRPGRRSCMKRTNPMQKNILGNVFKQAELFENLPVGMIVFQSDGKFLYGNRRAGEILGCVCNEQAGQLLFVEESDQRNSQPIADRSYLTDAHTRRLFLNEGSDQQRNLEIKTHLFDNDDPSLLFGVIEDITEKELFRNEIRTNRERYLLATKAARVGVWDWDLTNNTFYIDPNIKQMIGYEDDEIPNDLEIYSQYIHPKDREEVMNAARELLEESATEYISEHRMLHKDGSYRWFMARGQIIRDTQGKALRMVGTDTDITQSKLAEEALREEEERYRAVVEQSRDAIFLVDYGSRRILETNPALRNMTGYEADELHQMRLYDFLDHEQDEIDTNIKRIIQTGYSDLGERKYRHKNGTIIHVHVRASRIHFHDTDALCVVAHDITERKKSEKTRRDMELRLQQTQKLESLSVMAGGIAHDFNNLLSAVIGNASLALLKQEAGDSVQDFLERIEKSARRASELSRQLLAYAGKAEFVIKPLNLTALVREMTNILRVSISRKARIEFDLDDMIPAIDGDQTQIRQIIMNLLINASEALPDGRGTITIRTGTSRLHSKDLSKLMLAESIFPGDFVFLELRDSGCGISPKVRKKIFDPYYSTKEGGRGLGLASVLGIVRGHKGAIGLHSDPGKGTSIKIIFHISRDAAAEEPTFSVPQQFIASGQGRVLLIDEEKSTRRTTKEMLQQLGFDVLTAAREEKGLRLLKRFKDTIHLIILDQTRSHKSCTELLADFNAIQNNLPVIISNTDADSRCRRLVHEKRIAGFLHKPYSFEQFAQVIEAAIPGMKPVEK